MLSTRPPSDPALIAARTVTPTSGPIPGIRRLTSEEGNVSCQVWFGLHSSGLPATTQASPGSETAGNALSAVQPPDDAEYDVSATSPVERSTRTTPNVAATAASVMEDSKFSPT